MGIFLWNIKYITIQVSYVWTVNNNKKKRIMYEHISWSWIKCFRTCASGIIKMQLHGNVGVPCSAKNYCWNIIPYDIPLTKQMWPCHNSFRIVCLNHTHKVLVKSNNKVSVKSNNITNNSGTFLHNSKDIISQKCKFYCVGKNTKFCTTKIFSVRKKKWFKQTQDSKHQLVWRPTLIESKKPNLLSSTSLLKEKS